MARALALQRGQSGRGAGALERCPALRGTGKVKPEQACAIIALACETPESSGLPFTHWSERALADEAAGRGIVDRILQRSVGRILKRDCRIFCA